jgi:hypothetical protein
LEQGWDGDAGFSEICEHARRLQQAIRRITSTLHPDSPADRLAAQELDDVRDAWHRTQQMQAIYPAILQTSVETQLKGGESS